MEAVLIATRNELFGKDYPPVQEVRARLLRLDPDVTPTDAQINASPRFALRPAAVERDAPDIVPITGCRTWRRTTGWLTAPQRSSTPLKAGALIHPGEARRTFAGSFVSFRVGQASPPDGGCTPKLPLGMDKESPKGVPEKDIPDGKWEVEAGRLLPILCVTNDNAETGLNHVRKHWT